MSGARVPSQLVAEQARNQRWHSIQVRLTPAEFKLLKAAAGKQAPSGFARAAVRKAIGSTETD